MVHHTNYSDRHSHALRVQMKEHKEADERQRETVRTKQPRRLRFAQVICEQKILDEKYPNNFHIQI